jgi:hypothetical protein
VPYRSEAAAYPAKKRFGWIAQFSEMENNAVRDLAWLPPAQ